MKIKIGNKEFSISADQLEKIKDGSLTELSFDFDGVMRTIEEDETFIENHKKDARKEGLEKALRTKADELGLEVDGSKRNLDAVLNAFKNKVIADAKIEPTEQIQKLNQTLREKEEALQNALREKEDANKGLISFKNQTVLDRELLSNIPDNTILPKDEIKTLVSTKFTFDFDEDGKQVVKDLQGNVLKNKTTANPLTVKEVLTDYFQTNQHYLKGVAGGNGGNDDGSGGKKQSIDDFIKEQTEAGVAVNSPEFNTTLQERIKSGLVETE